MSSQCKETAAWSCWTFPWRSYPQAEHGPVWMCQWHKEQYVSVFTHGIPGITPPPHASEDWRPSIMDMIRLARINMQPASPLDVLPVLQRGEAERIRRGLTPLQYRTLLALRELQREHFPLNTHK